MCKGKFSLGYPPLFVLGEGGGGLCEPIGFLRLCGGMSICRKYTTTGTLNLLHRGGGGGVGCLSTASPQVIHSLLTGCSRSAQRAPCAAGPTRPRAALTVNAPALTVNGATAGGLAARVPVRVLDFA
jgi:hypothetical protein